MSNGMRMGPFLFILILALVALGYLLSDSMHLRNELDIAELRQLRAQTEALQYELAQTQSERMQAQSALAQIQAELQQREQSIQAVAFSGKVKLSGYVEYRDIILARVVITCPKEIRLGDSTAVTLTLIPSNVVALSLEDQILNDKNMSPTTQLSDEIQIRSVMKVELSGVGFDIDDSVKEQEIRFDAPSEWVWTIRAKEEGSHILVIDIAIPSIVEDREELIDADVRTFPIELTVINPIQNQFVDLLPYIIPAASGLIGIAIGSLLTSKRQPKVPAIAQNIDSEIIIPKKKPTRKSTKY